MTSIFEYNKEEEEKKFRKAEYVLRGKYGIKIGVVLNKESGKEWSVEWCLR